MGSVTKLGADDVRRICLWAQGLRGRSISGRGKPGAKAVIDHLGYIQIDTIAVIERAHHHTFWTRHPGYGAEMLDDLLAVDRQVFEYWTHAASYVPMDDYRFYLPRMRQFSRSGRTAGWMKDNRALVKRVLRRIREEGPLTSAQFEDTRKQRGSWWDWKPAKRALEALFAAGDLMVTERRSFQRVYDLKERVLPVDTDRRVPTSDELGRFAVRRYLRANGIAPMGDIQGRDRPREPVRMAVEDLTSSGELVECTVEGCEGEPQYVLADALDRSGRSRRSKREVHLLSPFDNAVIVRPRLKRIFAFDYTLECYLPEAKRKHGYFCLPILWGDRFVGRLDPKADRATGRFIVKRLAFERGFKELDGVLPALGEKLRSFAAFNGCHSVRVEASSPVKALPALRKALAC